MSTAVEAPGLVRRWIKAAIWRLRSLRLCSDREAARAFLACRRAGEAGEPVGIRVRGVPFPLLCRPGTSDAEVLWETFGEAYHRPPAPVPGAAVILDLGANVGYTAVDLALRHPRASVIAVELDAGNAAVAARNLERLGDRCRLLRAAVWHRDGTVAYGGDEAWGLRVVPPDDGARRGEAPAIRVETLLDRFDVERAHYLKMDIEGGEAEVLSDGGWMDRVETLKVEIHPPASYASCADALERAGFRTRPCRRHAGCVVGVQGER